MNVYVAMFFFLLVKSEFECFCSSYKIGPLITDIHYTRFIPELKLYKYSSERLRENNESQNMSFHPANELLFAMYL